MANATDDDKGLDISTALDTWIESTGVKKKDLAAWIGGSVDNLTPGRFAPVNPTPVEITKRDSAINKLREGLRPRNIRRAVHEHSLPEGTRRQLLALQTTIYGILGEDLDDDLDAFAAARAGLGAYAAGNWEAAIPILDGAWPGLLKAVRTDPATTLEVAAVLMDWHCYVGQPEQAYGLFRQVQGIGEPQSESEVLAFAGAWNTYGLTLRHLRVYRGDHSVSPEVVVGAHDKVVKWCREIGEPGRVLLQRALRDSVYAMLWSFDEMRKPVALPDNADRVLGRLGEARNIVGGAEPAEGLHIDWLANCLTMVECASVLGRVGDAETAWDTAGRFSAIVRFASPEINVPLRSKMDMSEMPLLFAQGKHQELYVSLVAYRDEEAFQPYADRQARVSDAIARIDRGHVATAWWPFVR